VFLFSSWCKFTDYIKRKIRPVSREKLTDEEFIDIFGETGQWPWYINTYLEANEGL
jgi:adenine-specific DNA methylase